MGDTWVVDLTHFLNEDGLIEPPNGPARRLAEHMAAIVSLASRPETSAYSDFPVRCRRRPGRKPCTGMIETDLDQQTDKIEWWCPVCDDNGYISNWKGSFWDITNPNEPH